MESSLQLDLKTIPIEQKIAILRDLCDSMESGITEFFLSNELENVKSTVGLDLNFLVKELEIDKEKREQFVDNILTALETEENLQSKIAQVKERPAKLADPFTWMLAGSAILYLFSIRWSYDKDKGFSAMKRGLSSKDTKDLLTKIFSFKPAQSADSND